ncbi:hypothetical protein [Bartonella mastomydis]|uniref:hypothetical protein n=1 Tax=Bartonella mastomydis TaxID=1820002 RepID=UPI0011168B64|nr:hypothetical protein [Bartonella mastomydis]
MPSSADYSSHNRHTLDQAHPLGLTDSRFYDFAYLKKTVESQYHSKPIDWLQLPSNKGKCKT